MSNAAWIAGASAAGSIRSRDEPVVQLPGEPKAFVGAARRNRGEQGAVGQRLERRLAPVLPPRAVDEHMRAAQRGAELGGRDHARQLE